ncbi:unnamed protein product, partial [Prorocentrum cordatum]
DEELAEIKKYQQNGFWAIDLEGTVWTYSMRRRENESISCIYKKSSADNKWCQLVGFRDALFQETDLPAMRDKLLKATLVRIVTEGVIENKQAATIRDEIHGAWTAD